MRETTCSLERRDVNDKVTAFVNNVSRYIEMGMRRTHCASFREIFNALQNIHIAKYLTRYKINERQTIVLLIIRFVRHDALSIR